MGSMQLPHPPPPAAGADGADSAEGQALAAQRAGDHPRAAALLRAALAERPGAASLHHNLGLTLRALGQLDAAIEAFQAALRCEPDSAVTLSCLGNALVAAGRIEEGVSRHLAGLARAPASPEGWANLARAYEAWARADAALVAWERAVSLRPSAPLLAALAGALLRGDRFEDAADAAARARAADPAHAPAGLNLAGALRAQARYAEAAEVLEQTLATCPDYADAHFNLGLLRLALGDHARGWAEREWRRALPGLCPPPPSGREAPWDGSPLAGRTLLLRAEQGLGDSLQFIRYARTIKRLAGPAGGRVLFEGPPALAPLLERCAGLDGVRVAGQVDPAADLEAPLMSVPHLLGASCPAPPAEGAYLAADPARAERWRARLRGGDARPCVGIAWQGNPRYPGDRRRSIPLLRWRPLLEAAAAAGIRVISLQKGPGREQLAQLPAVLAPLDLGEALDGAGAGAFVDSAAVIAAALDLVVSSDTAVPHLAGALGAPVWTLLGFAPDWRWGAAGERTPWYPTMRLLRQRSEGDWAGVLAAAAGALAAAVSVSVSVSGGGGAR
jgi:tetratricopeptide (TPR) repeat protein